MITSRSGDSIRGRTKILIKTIHSNIRQRNYHWRGQNEKVCKNSARRNSPSTTKLTFVKLSPARFEAVHVYLPSNSFVFSTLYNVKVPLSFLCSGRDPPLKFHLINGSGIPLALQGNVTFCPSIKTRSVGCLMNCGTTERINFISGYECRQHD